MTSHELARRLLKMPDLPVIVRDDGCYYSVESLETDDTAYWQQEGRAFEGLPAIIVSSVPD